MSAFMLAFIGAFLFSAKGILIKLMLTAGAAVMSVIALRMVFALPIYAVIAWRESRHKKPLEPKDKILIVFLGFIGYFTASLLDIAGLQYVSASTERMIIFLYPSFVIILRSFLRKRFPQKTMIWAFVVAYAGLAMVYLHDGDLDPVKGWQGSLMILGSSLCFSVFLILSEKLMKRIGSDRFTSLNMSSASIFVFIHWIIVGDQNLLELPLQIWIYAAILGTVGTVLPSILMGRSIAQIGADRVAVIAMSGPISTFVLGALVLNESFGIWELCGFALVLSGGWLLKRFS